MMMNTIFTEYSNVANRNILKDFLLDIFVIISTNKAKLNKYFTPCIMNIGDRKSLTIKQETNNNTKTKFSLIAAKFLKLYSIGIKVTTLTNKLILVSQP